MRGWGRTVKFQWVPREENATADWLSNVAYALNSDVTLTELQQLQARGELPVAAPGELRGPGIGIGCEGLN